MCRTKAGGSGRALIRAIVCLSVAATSLLGSRANPRWLSLIWTNVERRFHGRDRGLTEDSRRGNAARHAPDQSRAHPRHALEHAPAVDPIVGR